MRWNFDLSRNSSLRTLETTAKSITAAGEAASGFLKTVLSTVTSPLPLDLLINYGAFGVSCHLPPPIRVWGVSPSKRAAEALVHQERFKLFSEMHMLREFRLVLCADVPDHVAEVVTRALERVLEAVRKNGGLGQLPRQSLVISEMRSHHTRPLMVKLARELKIPLSPARCNVVKPVWNLEMYIAYHPKSAAHTVGGQTELTLVIHVQPPTFPGVPPHHYVAVHRNRCKGIRCWTPGRAALPVFVDTLQRRCDSNIQILIVHLGTIPPTPKVRKDAITESSLSHTTPG